MSKRHLKRYVAPKSWNLLRKERVYTVRPNPGAHKAGISTSLNLKLKQLGFAKTTKEVKKILNTKEILIDGRRVKNHKFPVGIMDIISIKDTKENFRVSIDKKGRLQTIPIQETEAKTKLCKIKNKSIVKKGKIQINFTDARNILIDKDDYSTGDTLIIEIPKQKIKECLKLEKNATILITSGKHVGTTGTVEEIKDKMITYKSNKQQLKTLKKFAFVIGKDKEVISLK